jgi:hypothetical protein
LVKRGRWILNNIYRGELQTLKITQAESMGLCQVCNSYRQGRCRYPAGGVLDYRNIVQGDCALTEQEIEEMKTDYGTDRNGRMK